MLPGTKYKNDRDILYPDENGNYTLFKYVLHKGTSRIDHVIVFGNRGGDSRKAWPLNDGRLSFRNCTPKGGYIHRQNEWQFKNNGQMKITGTYPYFYDMNGKQVWIKYNRDFSTQPYNFIGAVKAETQWRQFKVMKKRRQEKLEIIVVPIPGQLKHNWFVRTVRNGKHIELTCGTGIHQRHCENQAEQWIADYKRRLTERYERE